MGASRYVCFETQAAIDRYTREASTTQNASSCFESPIACPDASALTTRFLCSGFVTVISASSGWRGCCYNIATAVDGRPFLVAGEARCADVADRDDWCSGAPVRVDELDPATRRALAEMWRLDAIFEHASIASFARLTLELMSLGAPPDLLAAAQRAGLDEIEHARLCYGLASRYAGRALGPASLRIDGAVADRSLVEIAVAAVREGCVGETLAAVVAGERADGAADPDLRSTLSRISEDETRHAELAWRTVEWAIARGGRTVADAVRKAFAEATAPFMSDVDLDETSGGEATLSAHGQLPNALRRRVERMAVREIVLPMARSLASGVVEPDVAQLRA